MRIYVNSQPLDISSNRPLIEELREAGISVPSMCYAKGYQHEPSCMVCMVKDVTSGQMIPSCSTLPYEGMRIETDSDEVYALRRLSLELLLSDHRADCEGPCSIVCPQGIDVAQAILHYDRDEIAQAKTLLEGTSCEGCKAPCEKACRRRTVDNAVNIRSILDEIRNFSDTGKEEKEASSVEHQTSRDVQSTAQNVNQISKDDKSESPTVLVSPTKRKEQFFSRIGSFSESEKQRMREAYKQPSRCLHCSCEGRTKCKLRSLATEAGIKLPKYGVQSSLPFKEQIRVTNNLVFEPAKCIRCGLCVYNTDDGFTFERRGFDMQVIIPEESKKHVDERIADICPTGALFRKIVMLLFVLLIPFSSCRRMPNSSDTESFQEWTSFRGNASLNGFSKRKLPESPTLLWEHRHNVRSVASPIVSNGTVYVCDKHGKLIGFNEQGDIVSELQLQADVEASFIISDSVLYVGQIDGLIRSISLSDGSENWRFQTEGQIISSPTLDGRGHILVGSYDNCMYTLDALQGKLVSSISTGYYINGAAAMWHQFALFGGCDAWLRITNAETGEYTDSLRLDAYIPASPAVWGDCAYVADYSGNVYEVSISDGHVSSHRKILSATSDEGNMLSMPAVTDDAVYVLADERYLLCIERASGRIRWKQMLRGDVGESSPLVCSDRVLVCTRTGIVSIHDAASGQCLWEYETGEQIVSSPAVVSSRFYILTARGTLLCFGRQEEGKAKRRM
ncbi:MAG: PQQ-binding-like beta-propeller repeat protein [Bacteroidaceae bacterium]|nr:PQQ-binding-like beta-propeller repeat protein [Bacteroidaceae bacterium]